MSERDSGRSIESGGGENGDSTESILQEAQRIIHTDRNEDYGDPSDNHGNTAALWSTYLHGKYEDRADFALDPTDVCMMMILLKISRATTGRLTRDHMTDVAGYAGNVEMLGVLDE